MKKLLKTIVIFILTIEARIVLFIYKPKILVVTGTVGKTSTKDAIFAVFNHFSYARKSEKSFNGDIGIPLTILELENQWNSLWGWIKNIIKGLAPIFLPTSFPKWLILEIGTDKPGDIKSIARWLNPDVVVATQFADIPVHVEFFDSPEDVIEEEQSIIHSLKKNGTLIANSDDPHTEELRKEYKVISFGMNEKAGVRASHFENLYENEKPIGIRFRADYEEMSGPVTILGSLGVQHVYPVLAALSAGLSEGWNIVKMSQVFNEYQTPPGRMRIIKGKKNSIIIDDTYNSSPVAAERALEALERLEVPGRKVVVFGDMRELGNYAKKEHQRIGEKAKNVSDIFLSVGEHTDDFGGKGFKDVSSVIEYMKEDLKEEDTILIKGSQSVRLEKLVKELMLNPENARRELVRQEEEWTRR